MAQPLKVDRPVRKNICLPQSLVARVDLELWSDVEGKVPFAAWQSYIERLIRQDLKYRESIWQPSQGEQNAPK